MPEHSAPLPDYDELPVGSLQHRIRSLNASELRRTLDYERAHNDRPQVVEMLRNRLDDLASGDRPAPGDQLDEPVETQGTARGSPVSANAQSEPSSPPPHGVSGHHGKPKGDRAR